METGATGPWRKTCMTTAPFSVAYAYESTMDGLAEIKKGIEHGVRQAVDSHRESMTEEFNSANRAQLESCKPGCMD